MTSELQSGVVLFGEVERLFWWGVGSSPAAPWQRAPTWRLLLVPFPVETSWWWGDVVPMPSQAICQPPVSIAWPSRRMFVLETERLSPSPPFSGEGAQSFIHSETRLINSTPRPARVLPLQAESDQAWNNGRAVFSRKVALPFPSPCLSSAQHPWQAAWSRPTACPGQRRMESGPCNCCLAGWLSGEGLNLCHQHTSMLTQSTLWSFGRLGAIWMRCRILARGKDS